MGTITTFILYFLVFALFHSILAMDFTKQNAERLPGNLSRFYRIFYFFVSVITFAPSFYIWITNTGSMPLVYILPQWMFPLLMIIRLAAFGLAAYAVIQTNLLDFIGIRQMIGRPGKNKLITGGAYGIVRHPQYTGIIILLFTKMEMSSLDLVAFMFFSVYFIIGAYIEEGRLVAVFGDEYRKYRENVSMFIPFKWILKLGSSK
jgi:protein-S-isoprenylcysteine O-methyltransferase Ste14